MDDILLPQDRSMLARLLDPSTEVSVLVDPAKHSWLPHHETPVELTWATLTKEQRAWIKATVLELAPYLDASTVDIFFSLQHAWQENFLSKLALLNPAMTAGIIGQRWNNPFSSFDAERFFGCNPAAAISLNEIDAWPHGPWDEMLFLLKVRFTKATQGCLGWAYPKAIAESWSTSEDLMLRYFGKQLMPAAAVTPCRKRMTVEMKQEVRRAWLKQMRFGLEEHIAWSRAGIEQKWLDHASGMFTELFSGFQDDSTHMMVIDGQRDYLYGIGRSRLYVYQAMLRDFRTAQRIAGLPPIWHGLQSILEEP